MTKNAEQASAGSRFPLLANGKQDLSGPEIDDVQVAVQDEMRRIRWSRGIGSGRRVAIAVGSRGIDRIAELVRAVVREVRKEDAVPFLVPAMGSHGGATQDGQVQILQKLGISASELGIDVEPSLETEEIGQTRDGIAVYAAKSVLKADGLIVINRVKPHTSFHSAIESGLSKMLVVGLGKANGAREMHLHGVPALRESLGEAAGLLLSHLPVLCGVAMVENARRKVAELKAIGPHEWFDEESKLLSRAYELAPHLPFRELDVLVVDEMGKDISGTGMDTSVIGRLMITGEDEPARPNITRVVVLSLSAGTGGNANGLGLADVITRQLHDSIDFQAFHRNAITSTFMERCKVPYTADNDRDAVRVALETCWQPNLDKVRMLRIRNTSTLENFQCTAALARSDGYDQSVTVDNNFKPMEFDSNGRLKKLL